MKPVLAEIMSIGDELLFGQTLNTNAHWISGELGKASIRVRRRSTIGDQEDEILAALKEAEQRADIILITGGLGPTNDDITKPCLAKYFDSPLVMHEPSLQHVTEFFNSRGRVITEVNRQQAALPEVCIPLSNPLGTAPGMWFEKNGKVIVSMPGVPHEMQVMMTNIIIPKLKTTFKLPVITHRIIRTAGIGESSLAEVIASWEATLPAHIKLAYLPTLGNVKLRLTATGKDLRVLEQELDELVKNVKPVIGQNIYGYGEDELELVVGKKLKDQGLTLSIAESCTGGYLTHLVTRIPGSSEYFLGSIVPYAYEIKMRQLGVKPETLEKYGAVSEPTIIEMANLVRAKFNASIGVATSGIAGPGGATPDKPVGTIWIAYSDKEKTVTKKLQLSPDRLINIKIAASAVLNLIRLNMPQ